MQQGRRTASLKASYEAINSGVHAAEFSRELAGAAQTAIAAIQESSKKNKKIVSSANVSNPNVIPPSVQAQQQQAHQQQVQQQQVHQHSQQQQQQQTTAVVAAAAAAAANVVTQPGTSADMSNAGDVDNPDWTFDPNEPRYCICNQVSYATFALYCKSFNFLFLPLYKLSNEIDTYLCNHITCLIFLFFYV